jgi:hypothetical protein
MRSPINISVDEITRAAQWLADVPAARWPEGPADILVHRFDLKVWEARKAVERARKMQLLRRVNA